MVRPCPPTILVFLKAPRPGFVKTRLAAQIGEADATWLYRNMVERQLREIPEGWPVEVHFAPRDAAPEMRAWLGPERRFMPQPGGDLGERLRSAFARVFADGAPAAIAIGGDCPDLGCADFEHAREMLEDRDVALGPARDGGYYLIGLCAPAPGLFEDIPWSTAAVCAATLDRAAAAGLSCGLLDEKEDIDDAEALRRFVTSRAIAAAGGSHPRMPVAAGAYKSARHS